MSDIYLRDLKESMREETENQIKKDRPDLIEAMENGEDISIGEYYNTKDFKII